MLSKKNDVLVESKRHWDIMRHVKIWFAIAAHFKSLVKSEQVHVKLLHYRQTRQFTMDEILNRQAIFLSMQRLPIASIPCRTNPFKARVLRVRAQTRT